MRDYMLDNEFLYKLNQYQHKEIYARIISLNFEERPLEQIEGKITGGSINIDGNSAVRRTCNLTMIAQDVNITDFYWGVSNKFTLEIGVRNFLMDEIAYTDLETNITYTYGDFYPEIIWFKEGLYVITSFNSALTQNNYTISISGKDKMCLLNGDIGGNLNSSIDFGVMDNYSDSYSKINIEDYTQYTANKYYLWDMEKGKYFLSTEQYGYYNGEKVDKIQYYTKETNLIQEKIILKDIIREAVHVYGKEMYHNIVINDLDDYGLELLEYRGEKPLYLLYDEDASIYTNMVFENHQIAGKYSTIAEIPDYELNNAVDDFNEDRYIYFIQIGISPEYKESYTYRPYVTYYNKNSAGNYIEAIITEEEFFAEDEKGNRLNTYYEINGNYYSVTKVEYGDTAGYRTTDLTYAGELISSIGESLTSILDKIKNMLGPFEYFYDLDGKFIFQAKKTYSNISWNTLQNFDNNVFARDMVEESPYSYSFEDVNLIQKFQNTPMINNVKNDYSIWGVRKGVSGAEIPIHSRYAIYEKPKYYKSFDGIIYCSDANILEEIKAVQREEILQDITDRVTSFKPQYSVHEILTPPTKNEDGSWTAGWWDIRDWHDYYYLLKQEEPKFTMKWYSRNDELGCQRLIDILPEYADDPWYREDYVWLLIISPNGRVNTQHGSGNPSGNGYLCTKYESFYNENGRLVTQKVSPLEQKYFIPPYSGCSDNHTYLEFLENDVKADGNSVYFYNPNFPGFTSFEDAVQDQVNKEYDEMIESGIIQFVDWREILYQMAKDYYKYNQEIDFLYNIKQNNMYASKLTSYFENGETGYEIFYTDIWGFWRQLYDPNPKIVRDTEGGYYEEIKEYEKDDAGNDTEKYRVVTVWNPFEELKTFSCDYYLNPAEATEEDLINNPDNYSETNYYWNKNVIEAPELLNYWIDFFEGHDSLSRYSISNIGNRPKVVNNSKITSIYFRDVPQVIFVSDQRNSDNIDRKTGYTYIKLNSSFEDLFSISAQGKSAEEEVNELINNYSYCSEGISVTAIPVYYLEPNTLIYIHNEENGINGKYQVNKITVPLTYNGMMSITGTKIIDKIY